MCPRLLLAYFFICIHFVSSAQVIKASGGRIPNNGQFTPFILTASNIPAKLDSSYGVEEVCINISHSFISDLIIMLESPSGTRVELTSVNGQNGKAYSNTCFNQSARQSISSVQNFNAGKFKPEGYLGAFNNGQNGNGDWKLLIKDWKAFVDSGQVIDWSITFSKSPAKPLNFRSSNLPLVIMYTTGQPVQDSPKVMMNIGIIENPQGKRNHVTDPWNNLAGKALVDYRGSSSRMFSKKSMNVKIVDAAGSPKGVSLLGMPADDDWILYAPYQDKTLIRNFFTYELYGKMGHYSPRCRYVEVMIDGNYMGVYVLIEKIRRNEHRINIAELTHRDIAGDNISGGYILKIDRRSHDTQGWYSKVPGNSPKKNPVFFQFAQPKGSDLSYNQKQYIQAYVDSFEAALMGPKFQDPEHGYRKYIDINSFIDFFIINEISKNVDGYRLSTYLFKDRDSRGGKLSIGPVWDYDLAWRNADYAMAQDPTGWQYELADSIFPSPLWYHRMMADSFFVNRLNNRWWDLRQTVLDHNQMIKRVDEIALMISEARERNFVLWPIIGNYVWPNPTPVRQTYEEDLTDLKKWINDRTNLIDTFIPGGSRPATKAVVNKQ